MADVVRRREEGGQQRREEELHLVRDRVEAHLRARPRHRDQQPEV